MQVTIQKTVEVDLTNKQMKEITIQFLQDEYNIKAGMWIKNNDLMHEVEYEGHNSFTRKEVVREATENDKVILKILNSLIKG